MKIFLTTLIVLAVLFSSEAFCTPALSSLPSAKATIFLDFDGQYVAASSWNGANPLNCAPSGLTDAQIIEIFNRVSEDYRPFNIDITTDSTIFLAAPLTQRIRIIVTPTSSWYTGVGGVSYTGSFTWGDDTPGFVFPDRLGPNNTKMVAECCTHESGHTVGLSHQAKYDNNCSLLAVYNVGAGSGQTGWAPVMGNSYYQNFSGWYNGPTPYGCSVDQDALSIITTANGFTYRVDDHSDDPNVNPTTISVSNKLFADSGIITTSTDKDVFKFNLANAGEIHVDAKPFSVGPDNAGADLDIKMELLNSSLQVIQVFDPIDILNVAVDTTLNSGVYYLVVESAGNINTSNYGSLGSYNISGVYTPLFVTPIKQVTLAGQVDKESCNLNWNIIADEPISSISLETSANGSTFTTFDVLSKNQQKYSYIPSAKNTIYYRLKIMSVTDQSIYSNVISLKINNAQKAFKVSTMVHNEITVNAGESYEYKVVGIGGRVVKVGNGQQGNNTIDISNNPNGIYLIQILNNNQTQTERIVKM